MNARTQKRASLKLLILFVPILLCSKLAHSQNSIRVECFYPDISHELVRDVMGNDSIWLIVKEPFKEPLILKEADLGLSASFQFRVEEYCPAQLCKGNDCIDILLDIDSIVIKMDHLDFRASRVQNSRLSSAWARFLDRRKDFWDKSLSELPSPFDSSGTSPDKNVLKTAREKINLEYTKMIKSAIEENKGNLIGWILFVNNVELFNKEEAIETLNEYKSFIGVHSYSIILKKII